VSAPMDRPPGTKLDRVELFWIALYNYQPGWAFRMHIHDFFQIIYIVDGGGVATFNGCEVTLKPGMLLFISPAVPHSLKANADVDLQTIDIKFNMNDQHLFSSLEKIVNPFEDYDGRVRRILERIHHEARIDSQWHKELCNTLLFEAMVSIARSGKVVELGESTCIDYTPDDPAINRVLSYINHHFAEDINLETLGTEAACSSHYLSSRFRAVMGICLSRYIARYRIHRAKQMLRYTKHPVKQIAFEVGFNSVHHFTRVFTEVEGSPPAKWRKIEQSGGRRGVTVTPGFVGVDITISERTGEKIPVE
jgi:AraC-like DNA-binding protein/quercetin dioxygenase-like cupin family protein